jgi:hypothetical protein
MAKRVVGETKEIAKAFESEQQKLAAQPEPVLTFTEAQVQKVADFINYMYLNAEFKGGMKEFKRINQMFSDMHEHMRVIESHIFEVKRIRQAKKALE